MNKSELIHIVAAKANTSKVATSILIDVAMEAIAEALAHGEPVQFIGFGTFSVQERKARTGRHPQIDKEI